LKIDLRIVIVALFFVNYFITIVTAKYTISTYFNLRRYESYDY